MQPRDVIADRFELIRVAGSGGMGEVWQARDRIGDAFVALKLLAVTGDNASAGFIREALILNDLRHPGIVRYVVHGLTPSQQPYLVMEWLDGEDLSQRLDRGRLSIDETVTLLGIIAEALAVAHGRRVIHRDIKPSNLFLPGGSIERVKILDFGVARPGDAMRRTHTRAGAMVGTPGYMAPEQARGEEDVDARADVFALGCVAFECLTGRRAFEGEHAMAVFAKILLEDVPRVAEFVAGVPRPLDALVRRMLSKDRAERPRDALELTTALVGCGETSSGLRASSVPAMTRSEKRIVGVVLVPASTRAGAAPVAEGAHAIRSVAEERGARLEYLADGSLLAVLARRGGASDLAAQAAQCALGLRVALPGRPMALTMGRGEVDTPFAGEAIDRAARLLLDEAGALRETTAGIVLDEFTAGLLDARFEIAQAEGSLELRRELVLEEAPRTLLGRITECVGREREIAALEAIFAQCAAESVARAVLVTAPAGMGKSRLRNELVTRLRRRADDVSRGGSAVEIWTGRADPMRIGSAFGLVAQTLRQACGISAGEPLEQRQQRLRSRVARHLSGDHQRVIEFLGELVGAPFDDQHSPQLRAARQDAMLLGDQMRRAWEDFIRAQTETCPVLLVLEDLHWGDPPTVKLVDSVLRNLRDRPIMVLALARPEVLDRFPNLWAEREAQEVRLSGLTRKASTRLVRKALDSTVSEETVQRIVERAEGNAFYLEELIRTVAAGRGAELPETIVAMVQARLERLDAGARQILRAASVFGQTFWKEGTSELLGGATVVGEWLAYLMDEEIVSKRSDAKFAGAEEYDFRHALLREGAYAMLTEDDRALGHRLAGDWLDRRGERDAMVLAEHFERGGSRERALRFYPRAAEQALEGNDLEGVLTRIGRGIACGATGVDLGILRGIQAEAHNWRGEEAEGERRAVEAMALLPVRSASWYAAAREGIITAAKLGHNDRLTEIIDAARMPPSDPTAINARRMALGWGATFLLFGGMYAAAEAILEDLGRPQDAPPTVDPRVEAVVAQSRSLCADLQHRPGGMELLEVALAGFVQAGDLRNACSVRTDIGVGYLGFGAYEDAEPLFRQSLADAEQMNLPATIPQVKVNLGCALAGLGRLDEARAMQLEAAEVLGLQGDQRMEGASLTSLSLVLLKMREFEEAELSALKAAQVLQTHPLRAHALAALASALLAQGRPVEALQAADEAMSLLRSLGALEEGESLVRLAYAEALSKLGDPRASAAIAEAKEALLARAASIGDPARRHSFLERIEENSCTHAL